MVDLRGRRYGVDLTGQRIRIAGGAYTPGRTTVDTIIDVASDSFNREMINREADLFLAVSESDTIIKKIAVPPDRNLDPDKVAQFELSASLLDATDRYYIESFAINSTSNRLVIAYNRELVDDRIARLQELFDRPVGFRVRSWAMASGYTNFCRRTGGKLICLIEICEDQASYCLLKDTSPVDIGAVVKCTGPEDDSSAVSRAFILDLAATIQYRLAGIGKLTGSVPLSAVVVTGRLASPELTGQIDDTLGIKACLPEMKPELFSDDTIAQADKHLVTLGLTIGF